MSTTAPAASGFDFVMYQVRDMPRARTFYENVLGLSKGEFDSDQYVEYDLADGNTFALAAGSEGEATSGGGVMFAVDDVDAAVERVKAAGGTYFRNYGGQICDTGWCADPDGNTFGLHKRK